MFQDLSEKLHASNGLYNSGQWSVKAGSEKTLQVLWEFIKAGDGGGGGVVSN